MNTYKCEMCQCVFNKGWSDTKAQEEYDVNFPEYPNEDNVIVCDDCFKSMGLG